MTTARDRLCERIQSTIQHTDNAATQEIKSIMSELALMPPKDAFHCATLNSDEGFILGRWIAQHGLHSEPMMEHWLNLILPFFYEQADFIFENLKKQSPRNKWTLGHIIVYFCNDATIMTYRKLLWNLSFKIPPENVLGLLVIQDHQNFTIESRRYDLFVGLSQKLQDNKKLLAKFYHLITKNNLKSTDVSLAQTLGRMKKNDRDELYRLADALSKYVALLTPEAKQLQRIIKTHQSINHIDPADNSHRPYAVINKDDNISTLRFLAHCLSTPDSRSRENIKLSCEFTGNPQSPDVVRQLVEIFRYVKHLEISHFNQVPILCQIREGVGPDYQVERLVIKPEYFMVPNVELENLLRHLERLALRWEPICIEAKPESLCQVQSALEATTWITQRETDLTVGVVSGALQRLDPESLLHFHVCGTTRSVLLQLQSQPKVRTLTFEDLVFNNSDFTDGGCLQIPMCAKFPELTTLRLQNVMFNNQAKDYFLQQLTTLSDKSLINLVINNSVLSMEDMLSFVGLVRESSHITSFTLNNKTITVEKLIKFYALLPGLAEINPQQLGTTLIEINHYRQAYPQCLLGTAASQCDQAMQRLLLHYKTYIRQQIADVYAGSLNKLKPHAKELITAVEQAVNFKDLYGCLNKYIERKLMREFRAQRKQMMQNLQAAREALSTLQELSEVVESPAPLANGHREQRSVQVLISAPAVHSSPVYASRASIGAAAAAAASASSSNNLSSTHKTR